MLSATSVVSSGTVSDILTMPLPFPIFLTANVYVIVSNSCNGFSFVTGVPSLCFPSLVFIVLIFATFVSTSSVGVFPTVAVFFTDFTSSPAVFFAFTITSKLTFSSLFADTFTFFHVILLFSNFPSLDIVPSTRVVPSGILSIITVVPSTSDVFFIVIVYLIFSPTFASLSSNISSLSIVVTTFAVFFVVIIGVLVSGVSSPFTFAIFSTKFTESAVTFTLNDTITVFPAFISFFHSIFPLSLSVPPADIEISSVPSGIVSIVWIFLASSFPVFNILIRYVIVSPFCASVFTGSFSKSSPSKYANFCNSSSGLCTFKFDTAEYATILIGLQPISVFCSTNTFSLPGITVVCVYSWFGTFASPVVVLVDVFPF